MEIVDVLLTDRAQIRLIPSLPLRHEQELQRRNERMGEVHVSPSLTESLSPAAAPAPAKATKDN